MICLGISATLSRLWQQVGERFQLVQSSDSLPPLLDNGTLTPGSGVHNRSWLRWVNASLAFVPTGLTSAKGIGQYTAYALARHGVRQLALCDIKPSSLEETTTELKKHNKDLEILSLELDARKEDSVNAAIDQTVKKFGRIDIGINNAGIGGQPRQSIDVDFEDWQNVIAVNLHGVFLCQKAQIRQMLKQEPLDPPPRGNRGVIINTASMLGLTGASPQTPATAYAASKHGEWSVMMRGNVADDGSGVMGLTRTDALNYARQGIRINAMCSGYIATPLLKNAVVGLSPENDWSERLTDEGTRLPNSWHQRSRRRLRAGSERWRRLQMRWYSLPARCRAS